jgi:hypothetical protein
MDPLLRARTSQAKDAIAIMTAPITRVTVAMLLIATGFVSAIKAIKTPSRIRITAERETTLLVDRLIMFSNGTLFVELCPSRQDSRHLSPRRRRKAVNMGHRGSRAQRAKAATLPRDLSLQKKISRGRSRGRFVRRGAALRRKTWFVVELVCAGFVTAPLSERHGSSLSRTRGRHDDHVDSTA